MERIVETTELSDETLENVNGGTVWQFLTQMFNGGNETTEKDPNLRTNTTSYSVYYSSK